MTWKAATGVVLESVTDLNEEWQADVAEVLSIGGASAIALEATGERRYYRLCGTGPEAEVPRLSFGALLSWPADQNQVLESAESRDGSWESYDGEQGAIGATRYAIVPENLRQHYFRTRKEN